VKWNEEKNHKKKWEAYKGAGYWKTLVAMLGPGKQVTGRGQRNMEKRVPTNRQECEKEDVRNRV